MRKIDAFSQAARIIAVCLPPVAMSLIGLVALARRKGGARVPAGKQPAPIPRPTTRRGK